MLSVESIAGGGGPEIVLGVGVLLTLFGLLLRAVTGRIRRSHVASALVARLDDAAAPAGEPSGSSGRQPVDVVACRARQLAVLADECARESRGLSDECLAPLGRTLQDSRRLLVAEESVAASLDGLPVGLWLVERDVLVGALRIPFLALGATGVFAICPADGAWTPDDLVLVDESAERVRDQLPGFEGPVHGVMCLVCEDLEPRRWFGGEPQGGRGAWLLGLVWLLPWMFSFGPDHGLRSGDVRRLDDAAGPSWTRGSPGRLPATPNLG